MSATDSPGPFRSRLPWALPAILVALIAAPCLRAAENPKDETSKIKEETTKVKAARSKEAPSPDTAIRATADAFVKAFDRGDARAVAALWTEDGTMADDRGEIFKGRKAIEDQYAKFFKAYPGAKMEITVKSVDFPTPSMAVEDGTAQVIDHPAAPPVASRYTAVHVLENGKWLMATVRETAIPLASNAGRLQDLAWLIGTWESKSEGTAVRATFRWIANKSFIERDFTVRQEGVQTASGVQIIGWDPQAGRVRSWSFDATGGYGSGLWTPTLDGLHGESTGVLADGTPTSSQELLIRAPGENDVFGWRSFDRSVDDVALPDTTEAVFDRVPEKQ